MPGVSNAVFLSYASEDAEAAERIATALRAAGIEVWLDKSELRGGDAWDRQIRGQIRDCALFVPIISVNSEARPEGYFRLEWDLADQRTHLMGRNRAFVMPLCLDATPEREADVPDSFLAVQWTRLPAGAQAAAFVERVQRLLSGETSTTRGAATVPGVALPRVQISTSGWSRRALVMGATVVIAGVVGYLAIERPWISKPATSPTALPAAFAPPPHSIAVLPFVNMSGDKEQEYFSDGLTEELLNSLAEINELQVAARTSAFSFKGKDTDIGTIARKLNVGTVLEGSVRRSGNTVRVTTQLINAVTGFHLWSHTYDRDLGDVLKLETEIAGAVASALKVSLLGEEAAKIELGGTRNPAAFDAYLRARKAHLVAHGNQDRQTAIAAYTEAIGLDPNYALAFANRSLALSEYAGDASGPAIRESFDKAQADAQKAIALAPDLAEGHMALAYYFEIGTLDFTRATEEYERTLALAPGNARVLQVYGRFAFIMDRTEAGLAALRRAVVLDPLNRDSRRSLGRVLYFDRQNKEAIAALQDALALDPEDPTAYAFLGATYYALSDLEHARASCESKRDDWRNQWCLAITYNKLGRHADAEAELAKMKAALGDAAAYQYATIYAQWGNVPKALEWLDTALRLRDPGLELLKTDPILDPLRQEPRFQAVMRELKFPQ
jgi:TolB-like protein/Flp pilus assembly protein TadD